MQVKTIAKNIEKKLTEWLNTITDEELRKEVKKNILVSGGSITSMFLNEKINDFDIYMMDRNVLISLIQYYIKGHPISILKGWQKEETYPNWDASEEDKAKYSVAVQNLKPDQVKLYFNSIGGYKVEQKPTDAKMLASSVALNGIIESQASPSYQPKFFSPNAISLSDDIQIVVRFHGNVEEIHKTFDFMHATNYFTFAEGLVTNKIALESILTKQLKYQGSLYPLTTIIRIKKFLKRGWNINAGELLKVMYQISELDLKDINVLEEQLIGVDVAYFGALIDILRKIHPAKFNTSYLSEIIDRVFNNFEESEE